MNNETLTVLENCKDYFKEVEKKDQLANHLFKEINNLIKIETT